MSDQRVFLEPQAEPIFEVKEWRGVAVWSWNSNSDLCAICHESLLSSCITCQSSVFSHVKCGTSWGTCFHGYHTHCIKQWIATQKKCPLCQATWEPQTLHGETQS